MGVGTSRTLRSGATVCTVPVLNGSRPARDVDIVRLASIYDVDDDLLLASAQAVADYRGVHLTPVGPILAGYGSISQPKWAAWRRKEGLEHICEQSLDAHVAATAVVLDSVFARGRAAGHQSS